MENREIGLILSILLIISLSQAVSAQPNPPYFFKGSVTVNGAPAQDNLFVTAKKTNGKTVGAGITLNGEYGTGSNVFYIENPPGDNLIGETIRFFVQDTFATEIILREEHQGVKTTLDLVVTLSNPPSNDGGSSSGGGGGGGGGGGPPRTTTNLTSGDSSASVELTTTCVPNWECSDWYGGCLNGQEKRVCLDRNNCGTDSNKPAETRECNQKEESFLSRLFSFRILGGVIGIGEEGVSLFGLIIFLVIIVGAIVIVAYVRKNKAGAIDSGVAEDSESTGRAGNKRKK